MACIIWPCGVTIPCGGAATCGGAAINVLVTWPGDAGLNPKKLKSIQRKNLCKKVIFFFKIRQKNEMVVLKTNELPWLPWLESEPIESVSIRSNSSFRFFSSSIFFASSCLVTSATYNKY